MHSLVLSQCSELPHKLSSDIQELLRSRAAMCTVASSCANIGPFSWYGFWRSFFPVTLIRSLLIKASLHVLPRPNRPSTNLRGDPKKAKMKKVQVLTPVVPLREHRASRPHQSRLGKIFPEASVRSLEKMSLVGRSRHDFKKQAREELWFLKLFYFSLSLDVPIAP